MKKGQYSTERIIGFLRAYESGTKVADLIPSMGLRGGSQQLHKTNTL